MLCNKGLTSRACLCTHDIGLWSCSCILRPPLPYSDKNVCGLQHGFFLPANNTPPLGSLTLFCIPWTTLFFSFLVGYLVGYSVLEGTSTRPISPTCGCQSNTCKSTSKSGIETAQATQTQFFYGPSHLGWRVIPLVQCIQPLLG